VHCHVIYFASNEFYHHSRSYRSADWSDTRGWLVEALSWHWIFLINVPIGIIGGLATLRFMPDIRSDDLMPFDSAGYFLLTSGMVALSIALDGLSELHLPHAMVMLLLIFGFVSLTTYWLHAGRKGDAALFSLKLFVLPSYRIGVLGNLFARIGSGSMPFLFASLTASLLRPYSR